MASTDLRVNRIKRGLFQLGILYILLTIADAFLLMFLAPVLPGLLDILLKHESLNQLSAPNDPVMSNAGLFLGFGLFTFVGIIAYVLLALPMVNLFRGLRGEWKVGPVITMASIGAFVYSLYWMFVVAGSSASPSNTSAQLTWLYSLGAWIAIYVAGMAITSLGLVDAGKEYQIDGLEDSGYLMLVGTFTSFLPVLIVAASFMGYMASPGLPTNFGTPYKVVSLRKLGYDLLSNSYAAGEYGIYAIKNKASIVLRLTAFYMLILFGVFSGIGALFTAQNGYYTGANPLDYVIATLVMWGLAAFLYLTNKAKLQLVIPWSSIRNITVINERSVSYFSLAIFRPNVVSYSVGDFVLFLNDGGYMTITKVYDPYNKLNYLRNRYNLPF